MARIFMFRGLIGDVFSTGIDVLAKKLRAEGHDVSVHRWVSRSVIQRAAIRDFQAGKFTTVATIGHSLGGNSANWMSKGLTEEGIPVAYTATIDATDPYKATAKISDNFMSNDFRAKRVPDANEFYFKELNHIEIDKDERVHKQIIERLSKVR